MAKMYHITVVPRDDVTVQQVEEAMNAAIDWLHYSRDSWFVWTTSDAKTWHARLAQFVRPGGVLMICRVDLSDFYGHAMKEAWPWLRQYKAKLQGH